jgi:hypothetical protein
METSEAFLAKVKKKIRDGAYDEYFTLPFMSQEKLVKAIEKNILHKLEKGATPILSDNEIVEMIKEMKEASGVAFKLFYENGFIELNEAGVYGVSERGKLAIKEALKLK